MSADVCGSEISAAANILAPNIRTLLKFIVSTLSSKSLISVVLESKGKKQPNNNNNVPSIGDFVTALYSTSKTTEVVLQE